MKIRHNDFDNGGEIDYGAWHYDMVEKENGYKSKRNFALRLRCKNNTPEQKYEVYKRISATKEEFVIKEGTLKECVAFINEKYNYKDEVIDD